MKNKKLAYIVISSALIIISLYFVDQVLQLNYISKVLVKVILFSVFPIIYIKLSKYNFVKDSLKVVKKKFKLKPSHLLGIIIAITLFIAFIFIERFMNDL